MHVLLFLLGNIVTVRAVMNDNVMMIFSNSIWVKMKLSLTMKVVPNHIVVLLYRIPFWNKNVQIKV